MPYLLSLIFMIKAPVVLWIIRNCANQVPEFKESLNVKVLALVLFYLLKNLIQMILSIEYSRLIHIVPKAVDSLVN